MAISKIVYKEDANATPVVWMDTTDKTADSGNMLSGITALKNDGTTATGNIASKTSSDLQASGATVTAPAGYYASSASKSVSSGSAGTPTATKGTVSNHSVSVTPSVTNTTGYITGSTKTGTAVSVSASELVSGTKSISTNGTDIDVVNYAAVDVSVPTGTARDSTDVSVSGDTITVPAGLYSSQVTKTVASGSATTPATTVTANPSISVGSDGLITATASATKSVTPTVSAGYVSSGTAGTITVSGSNTSQLTTQAAQTIYPSTSDQTITSGKYLTGTQTVKGVLVTNLSAGNIKKDVVIKVGDSVDDDRITSVTGTYEGSGGGITPAEEKDVNFIDYDGTIVYSYTKAEFANLSALPANPSHTGLTAQGWNWSLSDAKTYVATYGKLWIGQMYVTSSGKTEIDIKLGDAGLLSPYLKIAVNGTATIDWGDGSTVDTVTGTSLTTVIYTPHTYATIGSYTISIGVTSGSFTFYSAYILSHTNSTNNNSRRYNEVVVAIRLGNGITSIGNNAFENCYHLQSVTMPNTVTSLGNITFQYCFSLQNLTIPSSVASYIGTTVFRYCYSLQNVAIPSGITSFAVPITGGSTFHSCYSLQGVTIPSTVTSIENGVFNNCYSLQSVTIPSAVTSIGSNTFNTCYSLHKIVFKSTTPPTVAASSAWTNLPTDCTIYIPYSALASYLSASNYPAKATYTYIGYATYNSGVTLPTQDSTAAYNVVWYASKVDALAQTNAILQGNGSEIYCRYTEV